MESLTVFVENAEHGDRLPTVRALMREFGVGQASVQNVFAYLKYKGLISPQVGRGSYVTKVSEINSSIDENHPFSTDAAFDSLLILSNASMNERCARIQNQLTEDMKAIDGRAVQISYHDTNHLLSILESVPNFDAIILQSHYEVIPVRLLDKLQSKARALVVDGHSVSGIDVDRMGVDWEQALVFALDHLVALGHQHLALISLNSVAQPILSVRRFFERLDNWRGTNITGQTIILPGMRHPTQNVAIALSAALDGLDDCSENQRISAMIFVGISDGMGIREVLRTRDLSTPDDISVILLGHPDVPTEHLELFTIVGGSCRAGADALFQTIKYRISNPNAAPQIVYLDICMTEYSSTRQA